MFLGRFGYFLASDSAFKEIYGNGAVYGGELRLGGKRIVGWLEGSYRERVGKFSFTGEETKVKVTGIDVGVLCRIIPGNISPYAGAGIGYFIFNENNVAIGAAHALAAHGVERLAVVDFDVHHGNGTEDIFSDDPRVLMVSTFQHPLYPYSGFDNPAVNMVNIPLAAGTGSDGFREAVRGHWLPALEQHRPEIVYVSAGFDAHREDPLAGLKLTEADYAWVTRELVAVAARHARGRIVSALEGGYGLSALGRSVAEHIRELLAA
jgi:acetoin utilization deacetylase AcuC-like enzyme